MKLKTPTIKKIFVTAIMLLACLLFISCGSTKKTKNGYIITPGVTCDIEKTNIKFSYRVLEENPKLKEMEKTARDLVFSWWGDSSTFKEPKDILPVEVYGENAPRGFADDGYIFIDPSQPDSFATLVHEYIHVQNPYAFTYSDGSGYQIMEMYVEAITLGLVGFEEIGVLTNNYIFFQACPKLSATFAQLDAAFRNGSSGDDVFVPIYGEDAHLVVQLLDSFDRLPRVFTQETGLNNFCQQVLGLTSEELYKLYENFN